MTLNKRQFPEQLKMFMSPDEIIDTASKGDSRIVGPGTTPREQWERPDSSYYSSLREEKLEETEYSASGFHGRPFATMPPVELTHGHPVSPDRPMLTEGHHRLAWTEDRGIPFMAVKHHDVRSFMENRLRGMFGSPKPSRKRP
jgi:hypothetical protein